MIPKQLKILASALLTISLGAVVSVKANPTIEPIQSSNSIRHRLVGHTDKVLRISFSPEGKTIASGSFDETVKLWSIDGRLVKTLIGHKGMIHNVIFSPDGQMIASLGGRELKLRSREGTLLKALNPSAVSVDYMSFTPDGQMIALADRGILKLWSLDGILIKTLFAFKLEFSGTLINTISDHSAGPGDVKFSPGGQMIASSGVNNKVKIWKLDGLPVKTFTGHKDVVTGIAFSLDGKTLASSSADKTVILWNLDSVDAGSNF